MNTFILIGIVLSMVVGVFAIVMAVINSVNDVLDFLDDTTVHHWDH